MQPGDPPKEPSVFQQVMAWANKLWGTPQEKNERQKSHHQGLTQEVMAQHLRRVENRGIAMKKIFLFY